MCYPSATPARLWCPSVRAGACTELGGPCGTCECVGQNKKFFIVMDAVHGRRNEHILVHMHMRHTRTHTHTQIPNTHTITQHAHMHAHGHPHAHTQPHAHTLAHSHARAHTHTRTVHIHTQALMPTQHLVEAHSTRAHTYTCTHTYTQHAHMHAHIYPTRTHACAQTSIYHTQALTHTPDRSSGAAWG